MHAPKTLGTSSPQFVSHPFSVILPKKNGTGSHDLIPSAEKDPTSHIPHNSKHRPSVAKQAEKLRQHIEKYPEENRDSAFEAQVEASGAEHLIDSGLRVEYIDGKLIVKCMPYAAQGRTTGELSHMICKADNERFPNDALKQGTEEFVFLKRGRHEDTVTLVIEIGFRNSDERTLQAMLNHATLEYMRAEEKPNLNLFLMIFENKEATDEWVSCLGLFDLTEHSAELLWCCEFSSAAIKSAKFLQKHSKEIRKTRKDNNKLQSKDYKLTSCENRWDEAEWTIPLPQLHDWIWTEDKKEFSLQDGSKADIFAFPLTDAAQRLDAAIQKMHGVSAMEDVEGKESEFLTQL